MLCAREMRGSSSRAKAVIFRAFRAADGPVLEGFKQADEHTAFRQQRDFFGARRRDAQDQVRARVGFRQARCGADAGVIGIEKMAFDAGALLHADAGAEAEELLRRFGHQGDAAFTVVALAATAMASGMAVSCGQFVDIVMRGRATGWQNGASSAPRWGWYPEIGKTSNDRLNQARAADQERGVQEQVLFFGG